jgi:hypothetical protein
MDVLLAAVERVIGPAESSEGSPLRARRATKKTP